MRRRYTQGIWWPHKRPHRKSSSGLLLPLNNSAQHNSSTVSTTVMAVQNGTGLELTRRRVTGSSGPHRQQGQSTAEAAVILWVTEAREHGAVERTLHQVLRRRRFPKQLAPVPLSMGLIDD